MIAFVFQTILFQSIFLLSYQLLYKNETFFKHNRTYLLLTSLLSLILPFVNINALSQREFGNYLVSLPEVILSNTSSNESFISDFQSLFNNSLFNLVTIYYVITVVMFFVFVFKLYKLVKVIFENEKTKLSKYTIIHLRDSTSAYSFFNFVFLGNQISSSQKQQILAHESVHVSQRHTLDLLWFEVLKILFWFNPLVYIYQNKINVIHEFLADKNALKNNKTEYYQQLLQQVFNVNNCSFINPFFKQSLIKKRIIMLQKSKSKQVNLAKYLLLIPMLLAMLVYVSCSNDQSTNQKEEQVIETKTMDNAKVYGISEVDQLPIFEGCEALMDLEAQKKCFSEKVSKHLLKNFNTKIAENKGLTEDVYKVVVMFKITSKGDVEIIKARAPHEDIESEAIRVINDLPKLIPATLNGQPVSVNYALPIKFKIY